MRPVPLAPSHDLSNFTCGHESLDDWLRNRAAKAEGRFARTYVVASDAGEVLGYYCLVMGAVRRSDSPASIRRNAPDPVPVALIGRLAVSTQASGKGLGTGMLQDALRRILQLSRSIGCSAAMTHAIDDKAVAFYAKLGFLAFPGDTRTMFLALATLAGTLDPTGT
jgi:GNAT superfamily N-acetyltransferase